MNSALIMFLIMFPLSICICLINKYRPRHYDPEVDIHEIHEFQHL